MACSNNVVRATCTSKFTRLALVLSLPPPGGERSIIILGHAHERLGFLERRERNGSMLSWNRWDDIIICTDWKDPTSCKDTGQAPDFSHGSMWEGEDPSLWIDAEGFYHMVSHNA